MRNLTLLSLLLLSSCDVGTEPYDPAELEGTWVSTFSSQFVLLTLDADDGVLRGTGEVAVRQSYTVEGTYGAGTVRLRFAGPENIRLAGVLRGDTLDAEWSGGPYHTRRVLLVRDEG